MNTVSKDYAVRIRALSQNQRKLLAERVAALEDISSKQKTGSLNGLTAYIVLRQGEKKYAGRLRESLAARLPDFMIPSDFVVLGSLPLSPNGKVNRRKLALVAQDRAAEKTTNTEPENPVETALQHIWQELLNREQIGVTENFFHLGGHSLLATQVVSRMNSVFNLELPLSIMFEKPTVKALAGHIESVRVKAAGFEISQSAVIRRDADLPLSYAQQRLWFLEQLGGTSPLYNIPQAFLIKGDVNVDILKKCVNEIIRRHEVLRTTFTEKDGQPVQVIRTALEIDVVLVNISNLPSLKRTEEVQRQVSEEATIPFDIEKGPLIRCKLLQLAEQEHALLLTIHHLVFDGWSMEVLNRELSSLYRAYCEGQPSTLQEMPIQYADFAIMQREWLQGENLEKHLGFWKERIVNRTVPELPTDHPRPSVQTFNGATHLFQFSRVLTEALHELSRREGVTLFMTLLAVFQCLLHRYTGQDDIVVGTPIANRHRGEVEGLIGFFVNTLVMQTNISGNPTFREFLNRVRQVTLDAYAHQDMPFEKLVEELRPERDMSRTPLFQVMFVLQNAPSFPLELSGLTVSPMGIESTMSRFDIEVYLTETAGELRGGIVYNTDLFDAVTIGRIDGHFQTLLTGIVENPDQQLSELPMLTGPEQHQLLVEWNDTATDYPKEKCIHELFEEQVERTPDAAAVIFGEQRLTYRELNNKANQLAHYLRKQGVGPEVFAGVCIERSLETFIGILGILKAGGAYVPLDPEYPKERLAFILEDMGIPVVLSRKAMSDVLPEYKGCIMYLDADLMAIEEESAENAVSGAASNDLAYVMYTSGSTGIPKGVSVSHRAVIRLVSKTNYVTLDGSDNVAQASTISFDASTFEMWGALLNGACLAMISKDILLSPADFAGQLRELNISVLFLTTAMFNQMAREVPHAFTSLRSLLFGGEAVDPASVRMVLESGPPQNLLHVYGPTESTTFTSWYQVRNVPENAVTIPIGKPISNTTVYILDGNLQPVPVGVEGELYIGGDGLARGYHNRPELTAEKFIVDPFSRNPRARLYRTGDLARYLPDGNIEFSGRIDHQIKIRGFRIEPGEIEAVLGQHEGVGGAVVVARDDRPGDKRLVAYVVSKEMSGIAGRQLRSYLKERLPDYMVPSFFVMLDSLPMTATGKVDRNALPKSEHSMAEKDKQFTAPRNELEQKLVKIWEKVLGIEAIGITDNFFEIGGHSLLTVQLIAEMKKETGRNVTVIDIFRSPTVEQLVRLLSRNDLPESSSSLIPIQPQGSQDPLFWLNDTSLANQLGPDQPLYVLKRTYQDQLSPTFSTIEKMAAYYIKDLLAFRPTGPYVLGGYCFWAVVALEMARQLKMSGHEVPVLFLVEPSAECLPVKASCHVIQKDARLSSPRIINHIRSLERMQWAEKISYVVQKLPDVFQWTIAQLCYRINPIKRNFKIAVCETYLFFGRTVPDSLSRFYFYDIHAQKALIGYMPGVYPGKAVLFRSGEAYPGTEPDWSTLAEGEVNVHVVPGAKHTGTSGILRDPHVAVWAKWLNKYLEEVQQSGPGTG